MHCFPAGISDNLSNFIPTYKKTFFKVQIQKLKNLLTLQYSTLKLLENFFFLNKESLQFGLPALIESKGQT